MEGILLDTMFELPGLEGVEQVVIGPEVSTAKRGRSTSTPSARRSRAHPLKPLPRRLAATLF
jgi:ATP-dependent protease Clp ATPase subunit